ncbi:hypothetical protein HAX54_027848, partial [Datura stramonium]|nr:hypothetical protein [Datura stramonium]
PEVVVVNTKLYNWWFIVIRVGGAMIWSLLVSTGMIVLLVHDRFSARLSSWLMWTYKYMTLFGKVVLVSGDACKFVTIFSKTVVVD